MLDKGTQTRLKDKGFYTGDIDGAFGPLSFGALIGYSAGRIPDAGLLARGRVAAAQYSLTGISRTANRLSEFLAQVSVESKGFTATRENLNYDAQGLANTWPSRYAVDPRAKVKVPNAKAKMLSRKPQLIANDVYGGRMGNDDKNDGWTYRGAFDIQLTGEKNWLFYGGLIGKSLTGNPALASDPEICHRVAIAYWIDNKVMDAIDDGDFLGARKIVNMGSRTATGTPNGLGHVADLRNRILAIL